MAGCYAIPLFLIFSTVAVFLSGCSRRSDRRSWRARATVLGGLSYVQTADKYRPTAGVPHGRRRTDEAPWLRAYRDYTTIRKQGRTSYRRQRRWIVDDVRPQTCRRNASFPPLFSLSFSLLFYFFLPFFVFFFSPCFSVWSTRFHGIEEKSFTGKQVRLILSKAAKHRLYYAIMVRGSNFDDGSVNVDDSVKRWRL